MFGFFKKNKVSFPTQLRKLEEIGFKINPEINPASLLEEFSEQEFVDEPYQLLLISMGGEIYKEEKFYDVSNDIWHLDTECIEDHGDYISIIERLKNMTKIDIQDIRDYIDIENNKVWVSFEYNSSRVQWNLNVDNDWLDPNVFEYFNQLIVGRQDKKIVVASLGQDCLIAYLNEEQINQINNLVQYKFK